MDILASILSGIAGHQLWFFAGLLVVVVLIIVVMAVILMRGRAAASAPVPAEPAALPPPAAAVAEEGASPSVPVPALPDVTMRDIRRLFRAGLAAYRETLSRNVYLVPWYLRTGVVASDDAGLLGCAEEVRPPVVADRHAGFSWRFYDRAVVIDVDDPRAAWGGVLDQLGRRRPMLPADGLILTVPLAELDDVRRATARGTELYARLWEIQRTLGFALPVYVVVTGCEAVAGFDTLAEVLPDAMTGGMLGWSSPYALETAFSPDFVGEAMQTVADGMLAVELEVFGASAAPDGGPLFALTERLTGTEAALRTMLGTAFKRTAYQETLYVRGLYFTGRPDPDAPALFGRDLLNRKIFPEAGLPKATRALAASRAWRRYAWPVGTGLAAATALLLLWVGVQRASTLSDRLVPILADIPGSLQQLADQRPAVEAGSPLTVAYGDPAARFVQGVSTLPVDWSFNPLPASWISGVPGGVSGALAVGYRRLALSTVRDVAEDRLRRLTRDAGTGPVGVSEFERLRAFAGEVGIAEGLARAYNNVDARDPNMPLDELLEFALGSGVARGFTARMHGWGFDQPSNGSAIPAPGPGAQRPIDLAGYRAEVNRRFRQFADAYLRDLAMGGLAAARLSVAANELELLAGGARTGADAAASYTEVLSSLEDASRGLSAERGAWVGANGPVLPPEFDALLGQLEKSDLLGPNLRADVMDLAQRRYDEAGVGTRTLDSVIGRLLVQAPNGGARLAPPAEQLRRTLSVWMGRRFARTADGAAVAPITSGAGGWDRAALDTIPPLVEDYLLFDAKDLPQAPAVLRASMKAAAQHQLRRGVEQILARALVGSPAGNGVDRAGGLAQLRDSARALRVAFPVLAETMQSFRQIGLGASADTIRDIVARQANAVLAQADRLLEGDQLYKPDAHALDVWVDGPLVPYTLFGQANPGGLTLYLGNARQEVATLAHDIAAPVVEILERPVMGANKGTGVAAKWSRIIAELDKYDGGRPNSSLSQLEKFVTVESAAIDANGCQGLGGIDGPSGDFFQGRLVELKQWIANRCRLAADARVYDAYVELAGQFNETLANRFPFATALNADAADPAAVRAFYDRFEAQGDFLLNGLRRGERFGATGRDALRFVETMAQARPLLTAAITTDQSGGLSIDPAFRVNRDREAGGSDIIEWRLSTPNGAVSSMPPRKPLRWYPGDKLSVTLRWAKDGTVLPTGGVGVGASVDGPSLRYDFEGPWSLFALARQHAAAQRDRRPGTGDEPLLMFEATAQTEKAGEKATTPTALAPAAPTGTAAVLPKPNVRVFMALTVKRTVTADGKPPREEKVVVPALPVQAPPLAPVGVPRRPSLANWPGQSGGVAPADRAFFDLGAPSTDAPMPRPAALRTY